MPSEETAVYLAAYPAASEVLLDTVERFLADETLDITDAGAPLDACASRIGVSPHTLYGLFVMQAFLSSRERFISRHGEEVYRSTSADVVCKTAECRAYYGVVGIKSLSWYDNLLRGRYVGIGRLQYTVVEFLGKRYEKHGLSLKQGDPVITIHIPSSGPLTEEACHDSYRRAHAYFKARFGKDVLPFVCHSWMLYSRNLEFFPRGGNLERFMEDFELLDEGETNNLNMWRIFGKPYEDYRDLPRKTRLQAALADYLAAGNVMGFGYGIFAHDGERILK